MLLPFVLLRFVLSVTAVCVVVLVNFLCLVENGNRKERERERERAGHSKPTQVFFCSFCPTQTRRMERASERATKDERRNNRERGTQNHSTTRSRLCLSRGPCLTFPGSAQPSSASSSSSSSVVHSSYEFVERTHALPSRIRGSVLPEAAKRRVWRERTNVPPFPKLLWKRTPNFGGAEPRSDCSTVVQYDTTAQYNSQPSKLATGWSTVLLEELHP